MRDTLEMLVQGRDVDAATMDATMDAIFDGEMSAPQVAALLVALRMKGETATELTAAVRAMQRHAVAVKPRAGGPLIDTCGTGGDGSGSFNLSTLGALVVAACGVRVAKHGNRAASSKCGSADLLEALGVPLELPPETIARSIDEIGIGFMFARAHHPAMKHVGPVRAELGIRTMFNFLGPLTNPASATHRLLGVGDGSRLETMARVLGELGVAGAWVVHGDGGVDEVALSGPTQVVALASGDLRSFQVTPEDFGIKRAPLSAIAGGDAVHNARLAQSILAGEEGPLRDAVVLNAAAALCAAGVAAGPREAAERAAAAIDSGAARQKLAAWVAFAKA